MDTRSCKHLKRKVLPEKYAYVDKPNLSLISEYRQQPCAGYWVSEKLDGIRALWNGREFISRNGRIMTSVPKSLIQKMPKNVKMDGEFYAGPDKRPDVLSVLLSSRENGPRWFRQLGIKFVAFDLQGVGTYRSRYKKLQSLKGPFYIVHQKPCKNLKKELEMVLRHQGEGLVLRDPSLKYIAGRHAHIYKVKRHHKHKLNEKEAH